MALVNGITNDIEMQAEFKRIDKVWIPETHGWLLCDKKDYVPSTGTKEIRQDKYDGYANYVFLVRRKLRVKNDTEIEVVHNRVLIMSKCLRDVVREVMKVVPRISWSLEPLKLDPQLLLRFLSDFEVEHSKPAAEDQGGTSKTHLSLLIEFLQTEYASILARAKRLIDHGEISFDLLWKILTPGSTLLTTCSITSEPRVVRLRWAEVRREPSLFGQGTPYWHLDCEYVECNGNSSQDPPCGFAKINLKISQFEGTEKIAELNSYPIEWHPNSDNIKDVLIERGRKWVDLIGTHHKFYDGTAHNRTTEDYVKTTLNGRIMIDRNTFTRSRPNYNLPSACKTLAGEPLKFPMEREQLQNIHFLLASPIVYGFSLMEKTWLEFNVNHVKSIEWTEEPFENLVLEHDYKVLVRSLVEAHAQKKTFDDFVRGKGLGLVFNLFGPPGVGKSLTAEAISEYLKKPLYIISAGDLGTVASTLDRELTKVFELSVVWNAVVLIDEADVFLEKRGFSDLERNAMVAVFLRQLEYFRGILFLTTNRVKMFDEAFQSRIHLSLRYDDLGEKAKKHIWTAFLKKAALACPSGVQDLSVGELNHLSAKMINGRQIKNVVKLATSLASHENEALGFRHLMHVMDLTERFESVDAPDLKLPLHTGK